MGLFGMLREAAVGIERGARWAKRGFFALPPRLVLRIAFCCTQKRRSSGTNFELGIERASALR